MSHWVAELTWDQVAEHIGKGVIAVLPIGAEAKEHGYHMPMNTDYLQARWIVDNLAEHYPLLSWPVLNYGFYPAFIEYPGSCTLTAQTFSQVIKELLLSIIRSNFKRIIILNTGISTITPITKLLNTTQFPKSVNIKLVNVYSGTQYQSVEMQIREQNYGAHADELETSKLLEIAPTKVRMDKAEASDGKFVSGPLVRDDPNHPNFSPSGVYGDPRLATKEKGVMLLEAMLDDIGKEIETMK
ncbi:MAG: creatininase family protein [Candidatus Kariarchaeaceae archaeon]|jgi:creatinine amidohydrolase